MDSKEALKIALHSEMKWRVIEEETDIVRLEVSYRKRWIHLDCTIETTTFDNSADPEERDYITRDFINEVYSVFDEDGDFIPCSDDELKEINYKFNGQQID
jgi:hypothetical protein